MPWRRPSWMLFTEAAVLRVLESLVEHANDFLNAFLAEDPRFKIDCDILHSGLEAETSMSRGRCS